MTNTNDEMRDDYDFKSLRIRRLGPGRKRYGDFVRLDADVAKAFPTAEAVNEALRSLLDKTQDRETVSTR